MANISFVGGLVWSVRNYALRCRHSHAAAHRRVGLSYEIKDPELADRVQVFVQVVPPGTQEALAERASPEVVTRLTSPRLQAS